MSVIDAPRARSNVVNLFRPASPAEREKLIEVWRRFAAMDQSQRARAIALIDERIAAENHPALSTAFAKLRDILAEADGDLIAIRQILPILENHL